MELREVSKHSQWRLTVPCVSDGLEVVVRGRDISAWFFGLSEEAHNAIVRGKMKSVVGAALTASRDGRFNLDFLLVGIGLLVVIYVQPNAMKNLSMKSLRASASW